MIIKSLDCAKTLLYYECVDSLSLKLEKVNRRRKILANNEIRLEAAGKGVRLWEVAANLGIRDSEFSRRLRHELPDEEKARIREIIREVAEQHEREGA